MRSASFDTILIAQGIEVQVMDSDAKPRFSFVNVGQEKSQNLTQRAGQKLTASSNFKSSIPFNPIVHFQTSVYIKSSIHLEFSNQVKSSIHLKSSNNHRDTVEMLSNMSQCNVGYVLVSSKL